MAADAAGNDLLNVFIPITGFLAFAPAGTAYPSNVDLGTYGYTLPGTWTKVGLITTDGGFGWTENRAESLEFFQGSYQKSKGTGTVELAVKLAETSANVRSFLRNATADANGVLDVDIDTDVQWMIFTQEVDAGGVIRRRVAGNSWLSGNSVDRSTRGEANGSEATFTVRRDPNNSNKHFREAIVPVDATPAPFISSVLPSGAAPTDVVTITGNYFAGVSALTIDSVPVVKYAVSADGRIISAVVPAAVSGASAVVVTTTSGGASNTYAYTAA